MSVKVKINNKTYTVNELKFGDYTKIEEQGFSLIEAFRKNQNMLLAMGFVCAVTGLDREDAEKLIEQHVLGGGNIGDIVNAFGKCISESDFFKRMLGLNKEEEQTETENAETAEDTKEKNTETEKK